jgi:hypothetical protein
MYLCAMISNFQAMKAIAISSCFLLLFVVSACGPTKYLRANNEASLGYFEMPIDSATYMVSFHGNGATPVTMTERYSLYRCAELTREQGYDYFSIGESKSSANTISSSMQNSSTSITPTTTLGMTSSPSILPPPAGSIGTGFGGTTTATATTTTTVETSSMSSNQTSTEFTAVRTIRMYHGQPPANDANIFVASSLIKTLTPYIQR